MGDPGLLEAEVFLDLVYEAGSEFLSRAMRWQLRGLVTEPYRLMPASALMCFKGAALLCEPAFKFCAVHEIRLSHTSVEVNRCV